MRDHRSMAMMCGLIVAMVLAACAASAQQPDGAMITVTGCVERDAASSVAIYKIIVPLPNGGSTIYQFGAPDKAVQAAVGKTAEVSGSVAIERRAGREVRVLTAKTFKVVSERCG